ncbi:MAG: RDD family protein [Chitinophagaceae bacterium]|nr:RDD family protein [Chitinophagaceae bacterium]
MSVIKIDTAFNIDLEFEIAEFHKRLLAYLIDYTLLIIYLFSMTYLLYGGFELNYDRNMGLDILVISLPMLLYSLLCELWMNGQTIGKKIMGIRVISLEGGEPTLGQFILRWITKFFEWPFLFGFIYFSVGSIIAYTIVTGMLGVAVVITIAVNVKNQRLGDMIAGTVVVNTKTKLSVDDTVFMQVNATDYKVTFPDVMRLSARDINTIKGVFTQATKTGNYEMCNRVAYKVKDVLKITTDMYPEQFLEKLLEDYNYLATRE